ncbi:MAG: hypothetical protein HUU46_07950 [Candidatus Hydrogenedentes bacterium]|nr:hypothetical protein [Candidatus Hydrogenedentota bacterium]
MRHLPPILVLGILPAVAGCATTLEREKPFSKAWAGEVRHNEELRQRIERMKQGELVLFGRSGASRAAIVMDDRGKAKLNVGKLDGLSMDVKLDTDEASFLLKYKHGWKPGEKSDNPIEPNAPIFTRHHDSAPRRMEAAESQPRKSSRARDAGG